LNGVFNQTITDSRLVVVKTQRSTSLVTCFQDNRFLPLKLKPRGWLHFQQAASVQSGKVIVDDCRYCYSLSSDPDDEQKWLFRYEYLLNPDENVPHAHLHVNAKRGNQHLKHIHFPTGRVSIEQIIAHLICEYGIQSERADWFDYLAESHKRFTELRTDPPIFP